MDESTRVAMYLAFYFSALNAVTISNILGAVLVILWYF